MSGTSLIRWPDSGLKALLEGEARVNRRSLHAEILLRLERSFVVGSSAVVSEVEEKIAVARAERHEFEKSLGARAPRLRVRAELCPHRVPAGQFCKRCDS